MSLFTDIVLIAKNRTTYDIGLIQARGYRTLKQLTATVLKPEGLTTVEWAIIGIVSHHEKGVRSSEVAHALGVQPPLVSRLIAKAEAGGWITVEQGEDKRERFIRLSKKGKDNIARIDDEVRKNLGPLLKGINARDLAGYLKTLALLSENSKDLPPGSLEDYIPE
jgi:DNA-binding MarR family transcriptional regulator